MKRISLLFLCVGFIGLVSVGCQKATSVSGPPTVDELKLAEEEQAKVHEEELAQQQQSTAKSGKK